MTTPQESGALARLDDYAGIIGQAEVSHLRQLAARLGSRRITMVNSTASGGGVAEILNRMIPLMQELGVAVRWEIMKGGEEFYGITKAFHNALHGMPFEPRPETFDLFLQVTEQNRATIPLDDDLIVIHDPQPAALVLGREQLHNRWIWRCHIDLSRPNIQVWDFLRPFVEKYDAALFSAPQFTQSMTTPQYLFYPSIDPLADKNRPLEPEFVQKVFDNFQIDTGRPIITQISRFDRLKDPVGVIQAYRKVRKYHDCQLVLAGGGATDDPEGEVVLAEVREAAGQDPDVHILNLPPWSHLEINALQSGSTIVVQKSLREGFGLTVSEALWKRRPVVASAVGGIPSQVIHRVTGMLTHSVEGTAYQIRFLLSNPEFARRLGENGRAHVKENFLLIHNLKRYLLLGMVVFGLA